MAKRKPTTPGMRDRILKKVDKYRESGLGIEAACKKAHLNVGTYYTWTKKVKAPIKVQSLTPKAAKKLNIHVPTHTGYFVVYAPNSSAVRELIGE